jgi:peptide/nickel transport system permease protein
VRGRILISFLGRRIAALLVLLLGISFLVFTLLQLAPGSPEQTLLGTREQTPQLIAEVRAKYGLDDPFLERYVDWLGNAVRLDFGDSIITGRSVTSMITARAGVTLFLGFYAFIVAVVAGVVLGTLSAVRKGKLVDRASVGLSVVGVSAPAFVTGVFLLYAFAVSLGWFPSYGAGSGFADRFWHLTLPALALAFTTTALVLRLTRVAMINALEQDYVVFARARGVPVARVIVRHAMRNALVPIVTAGGLVLVIVLTQAVLVEVTFALPGIGALLVDSVSNNDVPVVQGLAMILATTIVLVNLGVDLVYALIDPRIRFEKVSA